MLREMKMRCDDVEDVLREMTRNTRNVRVWRGASRKLSLLPALIFLHFRVRDMEIKNTRLLDDIYNDVSIEPKIHGKRIENERSKLASRVRDLLKRIGNFRQKLINRLDRTRIRVPFGTNTTRVADLATRVSDVTTTRQLSLTLVVREKIRSHSISSDKDSFSSSSSSSSSYDSDHSTQSSSSSSSSSDNDEEEDNGINDAYETIFRTYESNWDITVSNVVHMGDHMRYVISVQAPDSARTSWRLMYRYTAIKHFHRLLRSKSAIWKSTRFALPTKGVFRSKNDPDVVEERCKSLTKMLNLLTTTKHMLSNAHVIQFLCSERHMRKTVETEAGDLGVRKTTYVRSIHTHIYIYVLINVQVRHDLIGWLHKASPKGVTGLVRGWKRRYFVILGNDLCYFVSRLKELKGSINLRDVQRLSCTCNSDEERGPGNIQPFHVITRDRVYTLCSQSDVSNQRWIRAIAHVSRLVQTDQGLYVKSGLPLPRSIVRHWHRRSLRVRYKGVERGRKYKSSREKVKLCRLRFESDHHRWNLAIRFEDFEDFHDIALELVSTASLIVDSQGDWNLARELDDIRVNFSKRVRTREKTHSKKFGHFVAEFTERIAKANNKCGGVWDDVLECWLLDGRVREISSDDHVGGDDEVDDSFWDATLKCDDESTLSSDAVFDFSKFRDWYSMKGRSRKSKKMSEITTLKHIPLDPDAYLLDVLTSFWCRSSCVSDVAPTKLSRSDDILDVYFSGLSKQ